MGFRIYLAKSVYFSWPGEDVPIDLKGDEAVAIQLPALFMTIGSTLLTVQLVWGWERCRITNDTESASGVDTGPVYTDALPYVDTACVHTQSRKAFTYIWLQIID